MGNAHGRAATSGPVSPIDAAHSAAREMLTRNRGVLFEDRYTPVRLLGRGSYAEVVECVARPQPQPANASAAPAAATGTPPTSAQPLQRYAAKIIDRGSVKREDVERELAVLLLLADHPACLRLHEAFEEAPGAGGRLGPGRWVVVTELCAGGRLYDLLEEGGPLPEARAAAVLRSLLRFLAYAHEEAGGGELVDPVAWGQRQLAAGARLVWTGDASSRNGVGSGVSSGSSSALGVAGATAGDMAGAEAAAAGAAAAGAAAAAADHVFSAPATAAAVVAGATKGSVDAADTSMGAAEQSALAGRRGPAAAADGKQGPDQNPVLPQQQQQQQQQLLLPLGVVHRDVKLENLLLSAERPEMAMVKVIDMGCSTFLPFLDRAGAASAAVAPADMEAAAAAGPRAATGQDQGQQQDVAPHGAAAEGHVVGEDGPFAGVPTGPAAEEGRREQQQGVTQPHQQPPHQQDQAAACCRQVQAQAQPEPRRPLLTDRLGSPHYIAPEVLSGSGYDHAADVWSAGVVAFALLSGRMPFGGGSDAEVLRRVREGAFFMAGASWACVSPAAQAVVRAMLSRDPAQRPSARQLLRQHFDWFHGIGGAGSGGRAAQEVAGRGDG